MQTSTKESVSKLKSLREIKEMLPGNLAFSTIHRWRLKGLIGRHGQKVRLPMKKIAGKYYVSESDLWGWLDEINNKVDSEQAAEYVRLSRNELDHQLNQEGI